MLGAEATDSQDYEGLQICQEGERQERAETKKLRSEPVVSWAV